MTDKDLIASNNIRGGVSILASSLRSLHALTSVTIRTSEVVSKRGRVPVVLSEATARYGGMRTMTRDMMLGLCK